MRFSPHDQDDPASGQDFLASRGKVPTDWLTWLGLAIAAAGWALLVVTVMTGEATLKGGSLVAVLSVRSDIVTVAQTAIVSGFGLAVVGGLRAGFGALNRFFAAVLHRSTTGTKPAAPVVATVVEPEDDLAEPVVAPIVPPRERFVPASRPSKQKQNYSIRSDGSVEVETLLGTRVFATLEEARDFIH